MNLENGFNASELGFPLKTRHLKINWSSELWGIAKNAWEKVYDLAAATLSKLTEDQHTEISSPVEAAQIDREIVGDPYVAAILSAGSTQPTIGPNNLRL